MFDVEMRQVIREYLPEELEPRLPEVKDYLFNKLPNYGEGGPGEYTYLADTDAREHLDDLLTDFEGDQRKVVEKGDKTQAEAEAAIREMRNWVRCMQAREDVLCITLYRDYLA